MRLVSSRDEVFQQVVPARRVALGGSLGDLLIDRLRLLTFDHLLFEVRVIIVLEHDAAIGIVLDVAAVVQGLLMCRLQLLRRLGLLLVVLFAKVERVVGAMHRGFLATVGDQDVRHQLRLGETHAASFQLSLSIRLKLRWMLLEMVVRA